MRIAFVAIDQGQRYQKTGQTILAFKYYLVGYQLIEHVIHPEKGKDIWVMMMRDSIMVLVALKPKELSVANCNIQYIYNDMLPNIINVLTYHELTNENTLLLLKKKINELKTFDEQGNKNILNDDDGETGAKAEIISKKDGEEEDLLDVE